VLAAGCDAGIRYDERLDVEPQQVVLG
jgi:hypothetical protein